MTRSILRYNGFAVVYGLDSTLMCPPVHGWNENSSTSLRKAYEDSVKAGRFVYEDEEYLITERPNGDGCYVARVPEEVAAAKARLAERKRLAEESNNAGSPVRTRDDSEKEVKSDSEGGSSTS